MKITESELRELVRDEVKAARNLSRMYRDRKPYFSDSALIQKDLNEAKFYIRYHVEASRGDQPGRLKVSYLAAVGPSQRTPAAPSYAGLNEKRLERLDIQLTEDQEMLLAANYDGDREGAIRQIIKETGNMQIYAHIDSQWRSSRLVTVKDKTW